MACLKVDGLKRFATLTTRLFRLHCINGRPRSRFGMMGWTAPPTLRFTDRVASGQYRPQSGHSSENPDGPMEPKVGNRPCSSVATSLLQIGTRDEKALASVGSVVAPFVWGDVRLTIDISMKMQRFSLHPTVV